MKIQERCDSPQVDGKTWAEIPVGTVFTYGDGSDIFVKVVYTSYSGIYLLNITRNCVSTGPNTSTRLLGYKEYPNARIVLE